MFPQIRQIHETFLTLSTRKQLFSNVCSFVICQTTFPRKPFLTHTVHTYGLGLSPRVHSVTLSLSASVMVSNELQSVRYAQQEIHIQGGAKNGAGIANIPKTPRSNAWKLVDFCNIMLNTVINFLFKNFIALWRHSVMKFINKKVNDCVQHIIL